jgi:HAD superfamily hydrolase (TIGR01549 family)
MKAEFNQVCHEKNTRVYQSRTVRFRRNPYETCPPDSYLLEYIETLPSPEKQKQAYTVLDQFELQAAAEAKPNSGAENLVQYLYTKGIRMGIISRNSGQSIQRALKNFKKIGVGDFDLIISRDAPVRPKPSGDGILMAAERLNVPVQQVLMVGDYVIDVQAGKEAGAMTVLMDNPKLPVSPEVECDFRIKRLKEVTTPCW